MCLCARGMKDQARVDVVLSKIGRGILRDVQKQSPTPTLTSSSWLTLVQVQSQVGVEFDNTSLNYLIYYSRA